MKLENANGEACGGSLRASFADSCNSVFAPLGAKLGAERLVAAAERFGFNEEPKLAGAARSTIPAAGEIGDDLAVGSTAIGQGKVLTTPLQMAEIAAAIGGAAAGGRARRCSRAPAASPAAPPAPETARFIARAMRSVVTDGTGVGAAVPGVRVAGKTGTAELRSTVSEDPDSARARRPAARGGHHRHRRLVRRLRADAQAARGGRRPARRPGRGRRHRRARGEDRDRSGASPLDVEVDDARDAAAAPELNSSGRFWSESVLTLNSSSEPWITPWAAAESGAGIRLCGGIGSGVVGERC